MLSPNRLPGSTPAVQVWLLKLMPAVMALNAATFLVVGIRDRDWRFLLAAPCFFLFAWWMVRNLRLT